MQKNKKNIYFHFLPVLKLGNGINPQKKVIILRKLKFPQGGFPRSENQVFFKGDFPEWKVVLVSPKKKKVIKTEILKSP